MWSYVFYGDPVKSGFKDNMSKYQGVFCAVLAGLALSLSNAYAYNLGYKDTPMIPGSQWRVHDKDRPLPPKVPTKGAVQVAPPADAIILFDGTDMDAFKNAKDGSPVNWDIADGVVTIPSKQKVKRNNSIQTKENFSDFQLHIEWKTPNTPDDKVAYKGNSGLYFMWKYELQIYNSWDNPIYADGQAAAIYGQTPPLVNASVKPGEWQSYDVVFEVPKFDESGRLLKKAHMTVFHNGVLVHNRTPLTGPTAHKKVKPYVAHAPEGPIAIQDHSSPVSYRNIWIRRLD